VIITQTPLRIGLAGGGTDLPSYYRAHGGGAVVNAAIDKYIHVLVNSKFDRSIRVAYSKTENVDRVGEVQHALVREALTATGVDTGVEVHTIADIPSEGTGLGSSSTLTVGLLNALYAHRGVLKDARELAEEACRIEIDRLGGTLGKQDQYIAALGGVQLLEFRPDDTVRSTPLPLSTADRERLGDHLGLFYTGITRSAQGILTSQDRRTATNLPNLEAMRDLAYATARALTAGRWEEFGRLLDEGWRLKKELSPGITTPEIDRAYAAAKSAGAWGGKITGAGGGGFLLVIHPPEQSHQIARALEPMRRLPIRIDPAGSRILFVGR
jgi:D-glycero-alpha-D-manno-heptose-7-phosphate kinase